MSIKQHYSKEQLHEMSLIEIAYDYLKSTKQPMSFNDLMSQMTTALSLSDEEVRRRIAQFYTDLNIDGRFLALGENRWGLRVWYPVDTTEEDVVTHAKPKKKKAKKVVDEEIEDFDAVDEDFDYDDVDDFAEEEDEVDLLDDDLDDVDDVDDEFDDDDDVIDDEEDFDLDEDELDEDIDEELDEEDLEADDDEEGHK
ncbi:DNA-directed RNA polymerase subunit delta [Bacillus sp. EB600]|uniref:DNA-directed RNA polymerase subunit delta n=1 Tax=Bacillus sp. EB600 TaxID=2806345 RepID=UPI00210EE5E7|nr:DNA-directed RNA polymerase subunit delta [Bacillus sp. EB600]MCQ6281779.1 DNA-directed RNA polymerase subunit delta [Bacillus sp. EB600]